MHTTFVVWEPANVRKTSCTAWDPWTTHVLWLFQWARTVCERVLSGAAIVFQWGWGGDHPRLASTATSPLFLACKVNCDPEAVPCYLSLPPDHRAEAGANNHARTRVPQWTKTALISGCPRLHSSSPCLGWGWTWKSPMSCCAED